VGKFVSEDLGIKLEKLENLKLTGPRRRHSEDLIRESTTIVEGNGDAEKIKGAYRTNQRSRVEESDSDY